MVTLEEVTVIRAPIGDCFDLARNVEGEAAVASGGVTSGLIGLRERVTWRAKHFGFGQTLTSEITALERPTFFRDVMIEGTFRWMTHDHFFKSLTPEVTEMKDVFCFAAPLGWMGLVAEGLVLGRYMRALLRERNAVLKEFGES